MKKLAYLLACSLTGCVPFQHNGKDYQLVLGFGLMSVEQTNQVTVVSTKALGIHAGDGRFNLGLSSVLSTHIPTNSNVILEIKR